MRKPKLNNTVVHNYKDLVPVKLKDFLADAIQDGENEIYMPEYVRAFLRYVIQDSKIRLYKSQLVTNVYGDNKKRLSTLRITEAVSLTVIAYIELDYGVYGRTNISRWYTVIQTAYEGNKWKQYIGNRTPKNTKKASTLRTLVTAYHKLVPNRDRTQFVNSLWETVHTLVSRVIAQYKLENPVPVLDISAADLKNLLQIISNKDGIDAVPFTIISNLNRLEERQKIRQKIEGYMSSGIILIESKLDGSILMLQKRNITVYMESSRSVPESIKAQHAILSIGKQHAYVPETGVILATNSHTLDPNCTYMMVFMEPGEVYYVQ